MAWSHSCLSTRPPRRREPRDACVQGCEDPDPVISVTVRNDLLAVGDLFFDSDFWPRVIDPEGKPMTMGHNSTLGPAPDQHCQSSKMGTPRFLTSTPPPTHRAVSVQSTKRYTKLIIWSRVVESPDRLDITQLVLTLHDRHIPPDQHCKSSRQGIISP
ncbi:hypothetical protein BDZ85DRAFT_118036 [Elsinoe ampelina]|uniref:Uncharacterized protein n=1 Tax=Elsinoe ampelina TaxID=302913 RepID=A0A6A6GB45_9PEZI|nr:hypothetical protein BDZ85DRAFT_118036 [Elsinoe ampelina]